MEKFNELDKIEFRNKWSSELAQWVDKQSSLSRVPFPFGSLNYFPR